MLAGCSSRKDPGPTGPGDGLPLDELPPLDSGTPWWLQQNFAPVPEQEAFDLEVIGSIPPELDGLYVRNGSNPSGVETFHWFVGDGMLHGVRIQNGKALWYRSRYIQTPLLNNSDGNLPVPTLTSHNANVSVFEHGGKLLTSGEIGIPYEVSAEDLSTIGAYDYGGLLQTAMTAHPKIDAVNGEMLMFGYGFLEPPFLTYHRIGADGTLVQSEEIDVPAAAMMHNFEATATKVVFFDLPIVFDLEMAVQGRFPFRWSDDHVARLGVMPRDGTNADVHWFEIDPTYIFHTFNAYDDGDNVVMETISHERLWEDGPENFNSNATTRRYTLDVANDRVTQEDIDEDFIEFPQIDRRLVGQKHRIGYSVLIQPPTPERDVLGFRGFQKYDRQTGVTVPHELPLGLEPNEAYFAPAGPGEDDGYIMSYVYNYATDKTALWILDAKDFSKEPVAKIQLPFRVPHGFHGTWVPMGA